MFFRLVSKPLGRLLVLLVALTFFHATVTSPSMAGFVPSVLPDASSTGRIQDLNTIRHALELKIVQQRLKDLGFTRDEIESRLNRLSDEEIQDLAGRVETLKAGGDGVVTILVIVILILVILKLTGHELELKKTRQGD